MYDARLSPSFLVFLRFWCAFRGCSGYGCWIFFCGLVVETGTSFSFFKVPQCLKFTESVIIFVNQLKQNTHLSNLLFSVCVVIICCLLIFFCGLGVKI